jgi:hypothetical protein
MEHIHPEPEGSPFNFNKPITCLACKAELKKALINNYRFFCEKYGTEFDVRNIADLLRRYDNEDV